MADHSPQPAPDAETSAMAAGASSAFEGRRIGPYQLTARIGAGGMGEVYRATDTRLNRTVAIKVLHPHVAGDPHARERFEWEAKAVAALNHPHICTLYDVGSDHGHDYLVMEYVEGQTLAGPLPVDEAVRLATQIAGALDTAHQHGILHRDLKPSNVMRTKSGAKLLDFGLAKAINHDSDVSRTVAGLVLGTVAYMSPEQAEGKPLDERSDIFSFGTLLYEMLAGRRPFAGDTTAALVSAVLRDEPAPLVAPSALQQIVRRCLAKQAAQRFATMREVTAALAQITPTLLDRPSIAVVPFSSLSPDPENEYLSDGIAEEIINALTQIKGLHVAARTSSFSFKGKPIPVGEIAARLNVRHVLEGTVRKAGGRVRVTAQLVDSSNGYQLWSERYDRELADIFDVQDEIARAIVTRLKGALVHDQPTRLVRVTTENVDAYQHYLKGRAMLYRRGPWIPRALESFQTAVVLDPDYAQAWAGVADSYTALGYTGVRRPDQTMPAALQAATRATRLDPESTEAHNALAIVALLWERDFEKAGREFREALALSPQYLQARCWFGLFHLQWGIGHYDEGLVEIQRAFDADPLSSYATTVLSFGLATVGRFEEALVQARVGVQYDPESFLARWELGHAHSWTGRFEDAIAVFEPLWKETSHNWVALGLMPAYAAAGRSAEARDIYETLLRRRESEYVPPFVLATGSAALGDQDAAIAFCEAAVESRDMSMALFMRWWPDFERVRADDRFGDVARRFNSRPATRV